MTQDHRFRYPSHDGGEIAVRDVDELRQHVDDGLVTPKTPLFDGRTGVLAPAAEHTVWKELALHDRSPAAGGEGDAASPPSGSDDALPDLGVTLAEADVGETHEEAVEALRKERAREDDMGGALPLRVDRSSPSLIAFDDERGKRGAESPESVEPVDAAASPKAARPGDSGEPARADRSPASLESGQSMESPGAVDPVDAVESGRAGDPSGSMEPLESQASQESQESRQSEESIDSIDSDATADAATQSDPDQTVEPRTAPTADLSDPTDPVDTGRATDRGGPGRPPGAVRPEHPRPPFRRPPPLRWDQAERFSRLPEPAAASGPARESAPESGPEPAGEWTRESAPEPTRESAPEHRREGDERRPGPKPPRWRRAVKRLRTPAPVSDPAARAERPPPPAGESSWQPRSPLAAGALRVALVASMLIGGTWLALDIMALEVEAETSGAGVTAGWAGPQAAGGPTDPGRAATRLASTQDAAFVHMVEGLDSLARDFDVIRVPPVWLDARYLSDAGRYPEVNAYWERYLTFVREARDEDRALFRRGFVARLQELGVSSTVISMRLAQAARNFEDTGPRRDSLYGRMESLALAALDLHGLLEDRSADLVYDPIQADRAPRDPFLQVATEDAELREAIWRNLDRVFEGLEALHGSSPWNRGDPTDAALARLRSQGVGGP